MILIYMTYVMIRAVSTLLVAQHADGVLDPSFLSLVTAAKNLGGEVRVTHAFTHTFTLNYGQIQKLISPVLVPVVVPFLVVVVVGYCLTMMPLI